MNKNNNRKFTLIAAIVIILLAICFPSFGDALFGTSGDSGEHGNSAAQSQVETVQQDASQQETSQQETSQQETSQQETTQQEIHVQGFRNKKTLNEHYEKHGIEMGFASAEEYEQAAVKAATNPEALHKLEKEDGDDVYYVEDTNEFVIVSPDGHVRTYFYPDKGIQYFNKQ